MLVRDCEIRCIISYEATEFLKPLKVLQGGRLKKWRM